MTIDPGAPILVVGSVALDDIETPAGNHRDVVGGSANYFGAAASLFAPVRLVAVVGEDFPQAHVDILESRGVDTAGLERVPGRTFRWHGRYGADFGDAETLETQLNVFEDFDPKIPDAFRATPWVFLGNIHPTLQAGVLEQIARPRLVAADTMNFWITQERRALRAVLAHIDLLIINATEARMLSEQDNLYDAVDAIRAMGPEMLVIKKGSHGAMLFHPEGTFFAPAVPLRRVVDPTGAGDTFAAGLMGYVARAGARDFGTLKRAVINGVVMASFAVEGFGQDHVLALDRRQIDARTRTIEGMISLD
ncbi:MAG: PfkB family carbohydrate kinase [bacterium]